jgi:hypothetical protein
MIICWLISILSAFFQLKPKFSKILMLFPEPAKLILSYSLCLKLRADNSSPGRHANFMNSPVKCEQITTSRLVSFLFLKSNSEHLLKQSESELLYNWQSVSQYVLVSSPIWDFWPEIFFFWGGGGGSYCLVIWGRPLWREVGSVICQSLSLQSTVVSQHLHKLYTIFNLKYLRCVLHIYNRIQ